MALHPRAVAAVVVACLRRNLPGVAAELARSSAEVPEALGSAKPAASAERGPRSAAAEESSAQTAVLHAPVAAAGVVEA
jgi:hypothetical protein